MRKCTGSRWLKFSLVGLLGVALQLSLLALLTKHFGMAPVMATALAVEITVLHNFCWHERFTWRDRRPNNWFQRAFRLGRFHLSNGLVSLGGNTLLTYSLAERMRAQPMLSALASIAVCSVANFALADGWVYRRESAENGRLFASERFFRSGSRAKKGDRNAAISLTLKLSDQQATALEAKAAAAGLSLDEWIQKLAEPEPPVSRPLQHIANIIVESMKDVPPEIMATMPKDGASQHDHYIYGWPKKNEE